MKNMVYYFDRKKLVEEERKKLEDKYGRKYISKSNGEIYRKKEDGTLIYVKKVSF